MNLRALAIFAGGLFCMAGLRCPAQTTPQATPAPAKHAPVKHAAPATTHSLLQLFNQVTSATPTSKPAPTPTTPAAGTSASANATPAPKSLSAGFPPNAAAVTPNALDAGRIAFEEQGRIAMGKYCIECHRANGRSPNLIKWRYTPDEIKTTVRSGKGRMPPFGVDKITDMTLDAVVAYLQDVEKDAPPHPAFTPRPTRGGGSRGGARGSSRKGGQAPAGGGQD